MMLFFLGFFALLLNGIFAIAMVIYLQTCPFWVAYPVPVFLTVASGGLFYEFFR